MYPLSRTFFQGKPAFVILYNYETDESVGKPIIKLFSEIDERKT